MKARGGAKLFTLHRLNRAGVCDCPVCTTMDSLERWRLTEGLDDPGVLSSTMMNALALLLVRGKGRVAAGRLLRQLAEQVEDSEAIESIVWVN